MDRDSYTLKLVKQGNILGSPREDSMDFNESMQFNGLS